VRRRPREPELEHRLDEREQVCAGRQLHAVELWNGASEREVGDVDGHDPDRLGNEAAVEVRDIRRLQVDDSLVLTERAEQLSVTCVDGVDAAGAGSEQCLREPARGGADVEGDLSGDLEAKRLQRGAQFELAAEEPRLEEPDRRAPSNERRGFADGQTVDEDTSLQDECLRLG
jgi:hypothetical protein